MSQPTERRADELKIGDYIHDGRGMGPVEVAYTQEYRNAHGDQRVLLVTADAATSHHMPGDVFPLATADEMADAQRYRDRLRVIADIRALADWYEQHPNVPAPLSVDVRVNLDTSSLSTNAERRAAVAALAAAMGVGVEEHGKTLSARYEVSKWDPARVEVLASVWLLDEPTPDEFAEASARAAAEGNAAAVKMLETPLDELPDDWGADHDPTTCECEDCDLQVQHAETDVADGEDHEAREDFQTMGADQDREPLTVETSEDSAAIVHANLRAMGSAGLVDGPVYADSVNGEEL